MKIPAACAVLFVLTVIADPPWAADIHFVNFDQNHSTIGFTVPIAGGMSEVEGKFTSFRADLLYDDQDVPKSKLSVVVSAASINTGVPDRDDDLRSAHFFDVANHPDISFTSSQIAKQGDALLVSGTLDMHGVRRPLTLTCHLAGMRTDEKTGKVFIGGSATATIDRRDFGITWEHTVPGFVGDQVTISIHFISKLTAREPAPSPASPAADSPKPKGS